MVQLLQCGLCNQREVYCVYRNAKAQMWEDKLNAATYLSIVDLLCCNYYFRMFHGKCCMKHGVHVAISCFDVAPMGHPGPSKPVVYTAVKTTAWSYQIPTEGHH